MTRATPAHERALRRVTKIPDGCWLFMGQLDKDGYGRVSVGTTAEGNRSTSNVHRVVYEALVGPIPNGLFIDHLCRVRNCCNPEHLEPVTPRENVLRGDTGPARNVLKTHCPAGHEYAGANLVIKPTPYGTVRQCHTCLLARWKRNRIARKKKAAA